MYSLTRFRGTLLIFVIPLFFSRGVQAQAFVGGPVLGVSGNQIDGDDYAGYNKAGLILGGWVRTNNDNLLRVRGEIRYFGKGAANSNSSQSENYYRVRLRYIELPLMLQYFFSSRFSAEAGGSVAYLMSGKEDLTGDGYADPSRPFRHYELAAQAGAGYDFTPQLSLHIQFSYSLLPVREHPGGQTFLGNLGQYNNSLSICMYYNLTRKHK